MSKYPSTITAVTSTLLVPSSSVSASVDAPPTLHSIQACLLSDRQSPCSAIAMSRLILFPTSAPSILLSPISNCIKQDSELQRDSSLSSNDISTSISAMPPPMALPPCLHRVGGRKRLLLPRCAAIDRILSERQPPASRTITAARLSFSPPMSPKHPIEINQLRPRTWNKATHPCL